MKKMERKNASKKRKEEGKKRKILVWMEIELYCCMNASIHPVQSDEENVD